MATRSLRPNAKALEAIRVRMGLTLEEFAEAAGCSSRTMDNVMAGKSVLLSTVARIADKLGVTVASITEEAVAAEGPTYDVKFKLAIPYGEFDQERLQLFADILARLVGGQIVDADFTKGSTIVTVPLTAEQIRQLLEFMPDFRTKVEDALKSNAGLQTLLEQLQVQRTELPLVRAVIEVTIPEGVANIPDEVRGKTIAVTG